MNLNMNESIIISVFLFNIEPNIKCQTYRSRSAPSLLAPWQVERSPALVLC